PCRPAPLSALFPYTTLFRSRFDYRTAAEEYSKAFAGFALLNDDPAVVAARLGSSPIKDQLVSALDNWAPIAFFFFRQESLAEQRSEEHTSELQSRSDLVCRL